jgi:hypothetical protein
MMWETTLFELVRRVETDDMRKTLLRILVALIMFVIGLLLTQFVNLLRASKPTTTTVSIATTLPTQIPPSAVDNSAKVDGAEFPDEFDLDPYTIQAFIDEHPGARLEKLWQRLGITKEGNWDFEQCQTCKAQLVGYNLDEEPGEELILGLTDSDGYCLLSRFIVFKQQNQTGHWKLLGRVDAVGKFVPAKYVILISDEQPLFVVTGESSWGQGFSEYESRLFKVTRHGLTEIFSFTSARFQGGYGPDFSKRFDSSIVSCRTKNGRTTIKIEFGARYTFLGDHDQDTTLFTKHQTAVLVKEQNGDAILAESQSTLNQYELDHVYNTESMTEADFLKYNRAELFKLATRGTAEQKKWLRTYLKECDSGVEKRPLMTALRN